MVKLKIAIIGFGNFGQFLASKFIKYHDIIAYSRTTYLELCNKMNINFFTNLNDLLNQEPDIIIISVSISSFEKIITELSKYIDKLENKLIVDVLSVKEYPKKILLDRFYNRNIDILATHPMFGPDSGNTVNQWKDLTFVYDPLQICNTKRLDIFLNIFKSEQCKMIQMTCDDHDELTAKSQFITHLTGRILNELNLENTPINTSGYTKILEIIDNTCNDSVDLFTGIYKYNEKSKKWLVKFKEALNKVENILI